MVVDKSRGPDPLAGSPQTQGAEIGSGRDRGSMGATTPPASNTGVVNTSVFSFDWIAFTFLGQSVSDALRTVQSLFGKVVPLERGLVGYENSGLILGTGRVAWSDKRPEMGCHVILPSKALGLLSDVYPDLLDLLDMLKAFGAKFTRVDLALDDFEGLLDLDLMVEKVRVGEFVSRFRRAELREGLFGCAGQTLYFGSRSSGTFARIYDKRSEQISKGVEDVPEQWTRVELEFKGQNADAVVSRMLEAGSGAEVALGLLRQYVCFKDAGPDSNKSRWSTCAWWEAFLCYVERCRLGLPKIAQTVESVKQWLYRQVAPSLAFLVEYERGCVDEIYGMLRAGKGRLSPCHRALLQGAT